MLALNEVPIIPTLRKAQVMSPPSGFYDIRNSDRACYSWLGSVARYDVNQMRSRCRQSGTGTLRRVRSLSAGHRELESVDVRAVLCIQEPDDMGRIHGVSAAHDSAVYGHILNVTRTNICWR